MKLSIITINYNNLEGLKRTVDSVIHQSWQEFEYIIIDGGSTDGSTAYIQEMKHNIDYWVSEKDEGIYNAMNKGILNANGAFILFLNSGDTLSNKFSLCKLFSKIKEKTAKVYFWNILTEKGVWYFPEKNILKHFVNSFIGHSGSALFDRSIFESVGLYNESFKLHGDRHLYYRIFQALGESSFSKIHGYYSIYELGGGESSNIYRGKHSKMEKRLIEAEFKATFIEYFANYKYEPDLSRTIRLKIKILNFLIKSFGTKLFFVLNGLFIK